MIVAVGTAAAVKFMEVSADRVKTRDITPLPQMEQLRVAIAAFVTMHRRLPCPADGSLPSNSPSAGLELRDTAGICTSATYTIANQSTGIVPWKTLGLSERSVITGDHNYFSYRVFSGASGLTVDGGADMTWCDTDNEGTPAALLTFNGQCASGKNSTDTQFLQGKGLTVQTDAGSRSDVAYVLIHHGSNSSGAFHPGGFQKPVSLSPNELANTQGVTPGSSPIFLARTPNTTVEPSNPAFFDDRLEYVGVADLVKAAGLYARNWAEP